MGDAVDIKAKSEPVQRFRTPGDGLRGGVLGDKLGDPLSRSAVVQANGGSLAGPAVSGVAAGGVSGAGQPLPHGRAIQSAFGHHDISGVQAHTGPEARQAADALGTTAFATGDHVALASNDLHTEAHEAAHVVQQQQGVQLKGGVSSAGDPYERHADAVADAVVAGRSAEGLLDASPGGGSGGGGVQLNGGTPSTPTIRTGSATEGVTLAGDAASAAQAGGAIGVKAATTLGGLAGGALETVGAVGEILGFVGIGLGIFGIAENLIRGRDARLRFGAFTKAYLALDPNDPVRPYLREAAKQQQWENNRRWIRVAVSTAVVALSAAALIVGAATTAGAVLVIVAGVLAVAKGIETIVNFFRKRAARKRQEAIARELLEEAFALSATAEKTAAVTEMLTGLGIAVPRAHKDLRGNETKEFTAAVTQLAPHLGRAEEAQKEALQSRAEEVMVLAVTEAEAAALSAPVVPAAPAPA